MSPASARKATAALAAAGEGTQPRRGRGRPPRLSREQIIEAAVDLARSDPGTPLTVKRVAEAVGSAPMALYRYFPERDDLLHVVADRVANAMTFDPPRGATWQEQVRAWMHSSLDHLRPYPQLLPYIAATTGAAWLPSFRLLVGVLEPARLSDEDLALAITVIGNTIVGQALVEARRRPPADAVAAMRERLAGENERRPEHVAAVIDKVAPAYERAYDVLVDGVIAVVERLAGPSVPPGPPPAPTPPRSALTPLFSSGGQP